MIIPSCMRSKQHLTGTHKMVSMFSYWNSNLWKWFSHRMSGEVQLKPDIPATHKCHARPLYPKIFEASKKTWKGDGMDKKDLKFYLNQLVMVEYTFQHPTNLAVVKQALPDTLYHPEEVSSRTVSGFNLVYDPCYYPRVCYANITTGLPG